MSTANSEPEFKPYVPDEARIPEFTWFPVIMGALLGIIFGASSLYLVLKVGLTVSASIPVAVLSITLFRVISKATGLRKTTILENNIVQTTGSAGESLAFAVGLIMPALLLLGFDIDVVRVMTVSVLGGLLGILMMIPLRRAFIVKQHGKLVYPEGKACAEVLIAGEKGGATARMVFTGFGIGFVYQFFMAGLHLWKEVVSKPLYSSSGAGLKGGAVSGELTPALLGVGYIIGPRIASIMVAGGVLAYLVLTPTIVFFGESLSQPLAPAKSEMKDGKDVGLIKNMSEKDIRSHYILYIGAGAVAAGGIISMARAMPVIIGAIRMGFRDLAAERAAARAGTEATVVPRTGRDMSMMTVVVGSVILVLALAAVPQLGLGFGFTGFVGAVMIVVFGFLFVTVSARLTGEIGSSSNPISGMTVATLLLTCLLMLALDAVGLLTISKEIKLTALTIAGVVCIASSNGGSTAQALKTGHLVGATPKSQQWAILIGALTSALVVGVVLLLMNEAGSTYVKKDMRDVTVDVSGLSKDRVRSGPYAEQDKNEYFVLNVGREEKRPDGIPGGRYLVNDQGKIVYLVDPAVNGVVSVDDFGNDVSSKKYDAPKTVLMQLIIDGILDRQLPWGLVLIGVLIAVTLELSGVPSLPFAVGVYLPLSSSTPIFIGGMMRWLADKFNRGGAGSDSGPGVLLSSGYIAGGSIAAVLISFLNFDQDLVEAISLSATLPSGWKASIWPAVTMFGLLAVILFIVGKKSQLQEAPNGNNGNENGR
jgi:putative OPT family oligopeptide transporter